MGLGFDRKYCRSSTSRGEREKTLNQWHYRLLNWATTSLQNHLKIQTDRFPKIWISKIDDHSSTYFVNVRLVVLAPNVGFIIQKVKELLKDQIWTLNSKLVQDHQSEQVVKKFNEFVLFCRKLQKIRLIFSFKFQWIGDQECWYN